LSHDIKLDSEDVLGDVMDAWSNFSLKKLDVHLMKLDSFCRNPVLKFSLHVSIRGEGKERKDEEVTE
jgi:hypothetical protein